MKKALKWIGIGVSIPIVLFGLFVLFMVIADFKPSEVTDLSVFPGERAEELTLGDTFAITTFNIGYCGLDKGRDFWRSAPPHDLPSLAGWKHSSC